MIILLNKKWLNRIRVLTSQIEYWINNQTNKTVECIQLFYDNN